MARHSVKEHHYSIALLRDTSYGSSKPRTKQTHGIDRMAGEITIVLAGFFLFFQVEEYVHAYQEMGLTLQSGIYGNTFFLLTGFHGLHVCLGYHIFDCAIGEGR